MTSPERSHFGAEARRAAVASALEPYVGLVDEAELAWMKASLEAELDEDPELTAILAERAASVVDVSGERVKPELDLEPPAKVVG